MSLWIAPSGLGEERRLNLDQFDVKSLTVSSWFSDSRRVLISGAIPGKPAAFYAFDRVDASLKQLPTKHEGGRIYGQLSPDDQWMYNGYGSTARIRRVSGGDPQEVPGLLVTDAFLAWANDSKSIWITAQKSTPNVLKLYQLNVFTGERRFSRDIKASGTGALRINGMSGDGQTYTSGESQDYVTLTLVEGLK